ncbi:hypothetical protein TRAPUB_1509 [Trametes pubescens]|uniref:Uncharacterized protein n=1 Tax=Trametes pubescens TaxID=154538 RepID=A0A1M2W7L5_TRAPU|nr:hypothetical protein TRAPUB_1509 [Trametes pubescens]
MTERQRIALTNVAAYNQIDIPFLYMKDQNGQHVTKAEAYILIQMILDGVRPVPEYLDSLGRNADTYATPPHPQFWLNCDAAPTVMQMAWLNQLIDDIGIPEAVKLKALEGLTRGQASLLIGRLREQKGHIRPTEEKRMVFEHAVQTVKAELPTPKEEELDLQPVDSKGNV